MQIRKAERNQRFDMLRILFASLVILAHAPELTDGNRNREIWNRLTHSGDTLGIVAVDGFFILSGYLIVQSWQKDPEFFNFIRKRVLRIYPGFVVASVLSVVVMGLLAPGIPHFFLHLRKSYVKSLILLLVPTAPPLLPGMHYPFSNGSLWTLGYEFRCYLIVAIFGLCGILSRRFIWLALTVVLLLGSLSPRFLAQFHWTERTIVYVGNAASDFHPTAAFFVGGCFYLFNEKLGLPEQPLLLRQWPLFLSVWCGHGD